MNKYYPVSLNINKKHCLVVGGGHVAYRKVEQLIKSGARVRIVAPSVIEPILRLKKQNKIELIKRPYRSSDVVGMYLVYAATNNSYVNKKVFHDTRTQHILVNVVDTPDYCDFIMPAMIKKGKVTITVSTEGAAPYAAVLIKKRIDKLLNQEYMKLIQSIIKVRSRLLKIKRIGVNINIEQALRKLSTRKITNYIKENDSDSLRQYIDNFILSLSKDRVSGLSLGYRRSK